MAINEKLRIVKTNSCEEDSVNISPDNCKSITERLDLNNPLEKKQYTYIRSLVAMHLFSGYDGRRDLALKLLREFYNPNLEVHTLESEGAVWGYVSLTKEKETFFLVDRYAANGHILEISPTPEEEDLWIME